MNGWSPCTLLALAGFLITGSEEKPVHERKAALVITDVQNCFVPGGAFGFAGGRKVIDVINQLRDNYEERFSLVVLTRDWHCRGHVSTTSQQSFHDANDQGNECDSSKNADKQNLCPDQHDGSSTNTTDTDFHPDLTRNPSDVIIHTGYHSYFDSSSIFFENSGFHQTGLPDVLHQGGITTLYLMGFSTESSVYYTALDALCLGYITYVVEDATRSVTKNDEVNAVVDMQANGVYVINSDEVGTTLPVREIQTEKYALLVIDIQNCFIPGGSLPIKEGDHVIDITNDIRKNFNDRFDLVVLTQDWHCADHVSFASQHPGHDVYDQVVLQYDDNGALCSVDGVAKHYTRNCTSVAHNVTQTLWPDHCVMDTDAAKIHDRISRKDTDIVVKKGYHCHIDSYSAFFNNGGFTHTEMDDILKGHGITTVYVVGLGTDYCSYQSALDAKRLGYKTIFVLDATRGVAPDTTAAAIKDMKMKGIILINTADIGDILPPRVPQV